MPRLDRPTFRRAFILGTAFVLGTLSCGREVTGPPGTRLMRGFTFDARFDTPGLANGVAGTIVNFTSVRVVLVNSLGDTVVDRVVDFPSNADEVSVSLDVPVSSGVSASGETMSLALAYINAQNDTVFRGGPLSVQVAPSLPGQSPPPPPVVPVTYVGVGANAASVVITPPTSSVLAGDPFTFTGVAFDGQGAPIANTPIAWRSESPTRATITAPGAGAGVTLASRGPAMIIAQLLGVNAPADTVLLDVLPRAQSLAQVSGNNQTATFGAALGQPLVVRVSATDGQGMPGVTVSFAVTAGGGGVSAPSVVTDVNGLAQVTWTAGNGLGAQTVIATAAGLTGSPVTFTALAPLTVLLHHYPMNGDVADAVGVQNGTLVGGATIVDGALMLDGSGYVQFPSNLIPTSGSFSISLFVRNRTGPVIAEYVSQGASNAPGFYLGQAATGELRAGDGWASTGVTAPTGDGLFHHIAFVSDSAANTSRLYVDGTLRATLPLRTTIAATGNSTRLGRQFDPFNEYLDGDLDEVKIARGAITAVQVTGLHTAGVTAPGRLVFGTQPANVAAGTAIAPAVVVRVEDALGRVKTDVNGLVTISLFGSPAGITLGGTLTVNAVAGIATFANLTVDAAGSGYRFTATASGIASVNSTTFNVTAAPASTLEFVAQPTNAAPAAALNPAVAVRARDAFGNLATGFTGAVTLAFGTNPTTAVLGGTLTVNAVSGVATFANVTVDRPGTGFTLAAAATGLTGATSGTFTIIDNAAARLEITQQGTTVSAGIFMSPELIVTARTASSAVATTFTGEVTVSLLSGPGTIAGVLTANAVAGVATFPAVTFRIVSAGSTLLVSAPGVAPDTSAAISVTPGLTYTLAFVQEPTTALAGAVLAPPVVVRATDTFGNTTPAFVDPINLSFGTNPTGATLGGMSPVVPVNGIATFSALTVSAAGSGYRLQANGPGLASGYSTFFNITAGAQVNVWTNAAGGNWSVPTNWSLGRPPEPTDTVMILTDGTYTVTMDVNDTVSVMVVGGGLGVQTLAIGTRTLRVESALSVQTTGQLTTVTGGSLTGPGAVVNNGLITTAGGTIGTATTNAALIVSRGSTSVSGVLSTTAGSTIRLLGSGTGGTSTLAIPGGLINNGVMELVSENSGYTVQLSTPTLVNSPTGMITSLSGSGGSRTLAAQLENHGTVNIPYDLTISLANAVHLNAGTITLSTGDLAVTQSGAAPTFTNTGTIAVNGRTLTVAGGALDLTSGQVTGTNGFLVTTGAPTVRFTTATVQPRVTLSAATVLPDPFVIPAGDSLRIRGGTFAPPSLTNDGTLLLEGSPTVTTAFTTGTGSLLRVRGTNVGGSVTATFTNAITNTATIELVAESAGYSVVLVAPTVTNTAAGVINVVSGSGGGTRTLTAQLDNAGVVNLPFDLTINGASRAHVNSGSILLTTGDLFVTQSGTTPSFTNTGTIAANTRTVTVSGGTLDLSAGLVSGFSGRLVTSGTPTVRFVTATVQPRVTFSAGTVLPDPFVVPAGDSLRVLGGTFAPPSLTNDGLLLLEGNSTLTTALTTGTGSTLRVRGSSAGGSPTATFTNAITNTATIELIAESAGYTVALVAPTVTNTAAGVINVLSGSGGGTRTLTAQLDNAGVVNLPFDLTINGASRAHVNSGSILLTTGDLFITQTGTAPSFTNTGTVATNGRTFTVGGGLLDLTAGLVSGFSGRLITTGAPTVRFVTATVQPRVTFSAGTILPDPFVVPTGDSLRVLGGTFAPPSLTNNGTLLLEGNSTLTTALTTGTGSTLRVRGSSAGGSPTATFTNAIMNTATIELVAETAGYAVVLVAPTVTNTAAGVIDVLTGSGGGTRTLTAQLDNAGVVNLPHDLTINAASAAHVNSGSILLTTGDLVLTQTGTAPSFTNTGTLATNGRTVSVGGGTLDLLSGLVTGFNGRLVTTGAPTVRFVTTTVQPRVTFSAGTILPDPFVVATGDSLRVLGGTFSPPSLTNNGTVFLEGNSTLTTALTTGTGSTLRVRGGSAGGSPTATFTNPITNTATIDLIAETAGYTVQLVAPSVTNTATGVINSMQGSNGTRQLTARLDNAGTVNVPYDLTINAASAAHVNSGSILLSTGDLLITQTGTAPSFTNTGIVATNGRTLTVGSGLLDLQAGIVSGFGGRLITTGASSVRFTTTTVQPRVTFSAATTIPDPFVVPASDSLRLFGGTFAPPTLTNNGLLLLEGNATVTTALTTGAGSTLRVRGSSIGGSPTATFTNAITNTATIDLVAEAAGYTVTLAAPALANTATGVIRSLTGSNGSRTLAAQLTNDGLVDVSYDLTLAAASAAHVNNANITLTGADLLVTQTGTAPSFTNAGTITMNGRTLTVGGGTLDLTPGQLIGYTARLITTGAPTVRFTTATVQPRVTLSAGTILPDPFIVPASDSLRLLGGGFAPPSLTNNGLMILEGNTTVTTALSTGAGSTIRVRGSSIGGSPVATFTNAFTNTATIDLVAEAAGYTVTLAAPALANAATGVIRSLTGSNGARTLAAQLINDGLVDVTYDFTLNRASAAHVNNGTIALSTGDLAITQSGTTPSFTNNGTIATNGRTVTIGSGSTVLTSGLVSGYGGRIITTGTATFDFLPAVVQQRLTLSAGTTVPSAITVAVGDSLRLAGGTLNAPSVTVNGALVLEGGVTVAAPITTSAGSTTLVRSAGAFGSVIATVQADMSNAGTLRLIAFDAGYGVTLNLGANTLTNAAGGTIELAVGSNGSRTLTAGLVENLGTLTVNYTTALNAPLNQRGAMTVAATRTVTIGGLLTLFAGSTTTNSGFLTPSGGCSNLGGAFTGFSCP